MTEKQVEEERVYSIYTCTALHQRRKTGTSNGVEAGAGAETVMGAAYRLATSDLLSLLSHRTQDNQPRMEPPTMGWVLPNQSLIRKMPYSRFLRRHALN